jgi:DNA-binding NarL/FixJ family response regulator
MSALRIVLADDHGLLLAGVSQALEESGSFEVVGETRVATELIPLIARTEPDVVLLDVRMPGIDGLASLERIRGHYPDVKVVIFSASAAADQVEAALERGASGYIVKTIEHEDLARAVLDAIEGRSGDQALGLPEVDAEQAAARAAGLTERELTIIKLLASGLSNQRIARELWVTEQTVKFHLTNIYRKLGVGNRTEAARWAHSQGFIEPPASITSA